jgi:peptide/nickel transport system ATP-binding protein
MSELALDLRGLTVRDPTGTALVEGVSLAVRRGEPLVIIGETGSGKSLIAQALLGLLPAGFSAMGTVSFGGREPIRNSGLLPE